MVKIRIDRDAELSKETCRRRYSPGRFYMGKMNVVSDGCGRGSVGVCEIKSCPQRNTGYECPSSYGIRGST
jgi:hypothetical protein